MCSGLKNGCVPKKENRTSLLKPFTQFDKIKAMSIDEMARSYPCPYGYVDIETEEICKSSGYDCIKCTKHWLESEVEG